MIRIGYIDGNVKIKGHGHITGKYRGPAHRDCHINIKPNHKIPVVFHNLKKWSFTSNYARPRQT